MIAFRGLACSWNVVGAPSHADRRQLYLPRSLTIVAGAPLLARHGKHSVIGEIVDWWNDDQGLQVYGRCWDATVERAIANGHTPGLSIGVTNTDYRREQRDGQEVFVVSSGRVREVSVMPGGYAADPKARIRHFRRIGRVAA